MKLIAKAAAFTAAAAITATGLAGATGTSASAATVSKSVTYNCTTPLGATDSVPASFTMPALPATIPAGTTVPALPVSATFTVSGDLTGLAAVTDPTNPHIDGTVAGDVNFGSTAVPTTLTIPDTPVTAGQPATVTGTGSTSTFTPKAPGTYDVTLPSSLTATLDGATVPCTIDPSSSASITTVTVVSPLKATVKPKKVKAGHVAKIKVVTTPAQKGKAIAKIGKKKVAKAKLKNGKATLKVKGLKKTTKVKVFVGSLKTVVKVKVKK
jgi:hypothetical protein